MIQPNELRIGNFVLSAGMKTQVENITTTDVLEKLEGIPVTQKILERCGFKAEKRIYYKGMFFISDPQVQFGSWGFGIVNTHGVISTLKFVHQLQNLYFALTGEELTLEI
jgi:hypothetical protein